MDLDMFLDVAIWVLAVSMLLVASFILGRTLDSIERIENKVDSLLEYYYEEEEEDE